MIVSEVTINQTVHAQFLLYSSRVVLLSRKDFKPIVISPHVGKLSVPGPTSSLVKKPGKKPSVTEDNTRIPVV